MAGHSSAIKRNNAVPGVLIKRWCAFMCTDSGERIYFFEVLATKAFHFTVLQMRDIDIKRAAVVEQMGGVTAGLPSSWVSLFAIGSCIVSYPYTFKLVSADKQKKRLWNVFYIHCIYTVRKAVTVTETPEVHPSPCLSSHTLQGSDPGVIFELWPLTHEQLLYFVLHNVVNW